MRLLVGLMLLAISPAAADPSFHGTGTPYSGQESREIKSLSAEDVAELRRGGGWGLAKAAELNGVPGPVHLLELRGQLGLSAGQVQSIEGIERRMRAAAIREGEALIDLERRLDALFRNGVPTDAGLREALDAIEGSRNRLRHIHLSAHLETPALLSPEQRARYAALRGYAGNPCAGVPAGHEAALWKKHNGCH